MDERENNKENHKKDEMVEEDTLDKKLAERGETLKAYAFLAAMPWMPIEVVRSRVMCELVLQGK
jgi:hypothetical protein